MTTYEKLSSNWATLQTSITEAMKADEKNATEAISKKMSTLNATANASRLNLVKAAAATVMNPLTALQLVTAAQQYAAASSAVSDMTTRSNELNTKAGKARTTVADLIKQVQSELNSEFERGSQTSSKFDKLTQDWRKIETNSKQLVDEITQFGLPKAWESEASVPGYIAGVQTQLKAVGEFQAFSGNTATIATGVSNLQRTIYQAASGTMKGCDTTVNDAAKSSKSLTDRGSYYHATLTARDTLTKLLKWLQDGRASRWATPSLFLSFNLLVNMTSVDTLQNGWPHQLDHSAAELGQAAGAGMAQITAANYEESSAADTTEGQRGNWLTL